MHHWHEMHAIEFMATALGMSLIIAAALLLSVGVLRFACRVVVRKIKAVWERV